MKYLLDTADYKKVVEWKDYICGVTFNPILLKQSNTDATRFYNQIVADAEISLREFFVFIQIKTEHDKLVDLSKEQPVKVVYKVPIVYHQDLKTIIKLNPNHEVCGTMVYDLIQLNEAVRLDMEYCIVLHAKNENKNFAKEAMGFVNEIGSGTKLIAASVRTKNDVKHFLQLGYEYATIPPDVMAKLFTNNQASKDWKNTYEHSGNNTSQV